MTVAQNSVDRLNRNQTAVPLPVTSNLSINEGDAVYWDSTNYTVTPVTNKSQITGATPTFLGFALQTSPALIYPSDNPNPSIEVLVRGTMWCNTTNAETYTWFTAVTIGADSQTITTSGANATVGSSYNIVGYTIPDPPSTARPNQATPVPESVTGGSGVRVRVLVVPAFAAAAAV